MVKADIQIKVTVNANRVAKALAARIKRLELSSGEMVAETAQFAKTYMIQIAPYDTGLTANAITWTKGKTASSATVIIREGHADRVGLINANGGTGGLTWYMNYGAKNLTHWKTGNPRFIDAGIIKAKELLGKKVRRIVTAFVK